MVLDTKEIASQADDLISIIERLVNQPPIIIISVMLILSVYCLYRVELSRQKLSKQLGNYRSWVYFQVARHKDGTESKARDVVKELDKHDL